MNYFKLIFLDEWKSGYWIFAFVTFLFNFFIPENYISIKYKILIFGITIILAFILKLSFQLINFKEQNYILKGYNKGKGVYNDVEVLKIQKHHNLQNDLILTMYDNSTSISSPVAIVKIVEINDKYALAIKMAPEKKGLNSIIGNTNTNNFYFSNKIKETTLKNLSNENI